MRSRHKGQGVIEYAGALIIGTLTVAALLAVAPDAMVTFFAGVVTRIEAFLLAFF